MSKTVHRFCMSKADLLRGKVGNGYFRQQPSGFSCECFVLMKLYSNKWRFCVRNPNIQSTLKENIRKAHYALGKAQKRKLMCFLTHDVCVKEGSFLFIFLCFATAIIFRFSHWKPINQSREAQLPSTENEVRQFLVFDGSRAAAVNKSKQRFVSYSASERQS